MGCDNRSWQERLADIELRLTQLETGKKAKPVKVFYPTTKALAERFGLTQVEQLALVINMHNNGRSYPSDGYASDVVRARSLGQGHGMTSLLEAEKLLSIKPPLSDKQIEQLISPGAKGYRTAW